MTANTTHGYHVRAQHRSTTDWHGGARTWYGVVVKPDGSWLWSCEHAHVLSITARACARVELEDRQRAYRRNRMAS